MSEHYDFHYQPTGSGAISGQQVLQQTEDAINELGDYVNDNVGGAMDVAQQALETAQNAEQDAQTALDTANSFSDAIQSAQQDASTALSTAQTAQTTASNANNTAIQAQQDASSAVTTANNASGQVSTLSGTVTALGQRVTTAEGNIGQNTSDITALTTRVGTAEGNITTLQNDVSIAQGNASSAMATAGTVKQQAFVFRYSSTALVASSTNSNSLLDNTDNLKVGDKVIDSSGVLFSITAIDTANSTFTIGTALIDLAQDSDVVHTSGNETVGGVKTFNDLQIIGYGTQYKGGRNAYILPEFSAGYSGLSITTLGFSQTLKIGNFVLDANNKPTLDSSKAYIQIATGENNNVNACILEPRNSIFSSLGTSSNKWSGVYATNYYYGNDNVEFSTKFVTTDTAQTISGSKTFNSNTYIYNSDTTANTPYLYLKNSKTTKGSTSEIGGQIVKFVDKNNSNLCEIESTVTSNGACELRLKSNTLDSNNQNVQTGVTLISNTNGFKRFCPTNDGDVSCGYSTLKWAGVYATKYYYGSDNVEFSTKFVTTDTAQTISGNKTFSSINAVEPSSLSLPSGNVSDVIDISSYISALDGTSNSYTVPANGWISIAVVGTAIDIVSTSWSDSRLRASSGNVRMLYPVIKNETLAISVTGTTLAYARFIPCQGNV